MEQVELQPTLTLSRFENLPHKKYTSDLNGHIICGVCLRARLYVCFRVPQRPGALVPSCGAAWIMSSLICFKVSFETRFGEALPVCHER